MNRLVISLLLWCWVLTEHPSVQDGVRNHAKGCGHSQKKGISPGLTIGAREVTKGHWPWMVALLDEHRNVFCGGVLINNHYVLTTANCVLGKSPKNVIVLLGESLVAAKKEDLRVKVDQIITHPRYSQTEEENDLALLHMESSSSSKSIRQICLPSTDLPNEGQRGLVAGWESTENGNFVLKEVALSVWNHEDCQRAFGVALNESLQFCADGANGNDLCRFGAGGPLVIPTSGRWILAGILSYGNECTTSGSAPGIFTRITSYVEWIRMITDPSGCGRRLRSGSSRKKRIVGGDTVQEGEWPWMAALIADGSVFCGGVLITNRHVLTVASCLDERSPDEITVRLGEHDLATFGSTEKNFQVDSIQIHERFLLMNKINDIAVIKLKGTVTFTADIQPICLPQKHIPLNGTTALAAGWGYVDDSEPSSVLLQVELPIWKHEECQKVANRKNDPFSDKQICAGYKEGGKDTCSGDAGGPLIIQSADDRWTLIGLTSFGSGCADPDSPGFYTRIDSYWNWIRFKVLNSS